MGKCLISQFVIVMKELKCKMCGISKKHSAVFVDGLCDQCRDINSLSSFDISKYLIELDKIIKKTESENKKIIVALSGGKDSCYTLLSLRKRYPKVKIIGVQFDNGFLSENAIDNAKNICAKTNSEYVPVSVNESELNKLFKKAAILKNPFGKKSILRASDLCTICIGIVKQKVFSIALKNDSDIVAFGWTPGQSFNPIICLSKSILEWNRNEFIKCLDKLSCKNIPDFVIDSDLLKKRSDSLFLIHPLSLLDYNEKKIVKNLKKSGWKNPKDTDSNSTNCLLNAFAISNHFEKYDLHPYALEIHGLIRNKFMHKKEGLKKLSKKPSRSSILLAKKRLGLDE